MTRPLERYLDADVSDIEAIAMTVKVELTPTLEAFARESVDNGQYDSIDAVIRDGLRLLQARTEAKRAFTEMLLDARASADRDGTVSMDEVLAEMDAEIAAARR